MKMKSTWAICSAFLLASFCTLASAEEAYPKAQPIRLIVPFSAGGGSDTIARSVNMPLGEELGQTVIVENRSGAGGTIATQHVAKSAPDGYTILFTVSSHSINEVLYPDLSFDTQGDLRGVTLIGTLPQVITVSASTPVNNMKEWMELVHKDQRYRQYASGGVGSPGHFAAALLQSMTDLPLEHVPYRGSGAAMADVVGNQTPAMFSTLSGVLPLIESGKLKAIAVTSPERSPLLPDVETIAESVPGYEADTWIGTFVPRETPDAIVQQLHAATLKVLKEPATQQRMKEQAGNIIGGSPEELDALVDREIKQFAKIIEEQNIQAK